MKYQKLNQWLQVSANVGIVLGLVLVGVQLKQNSDLLKTQLLYEESQRAIELETRFIGENGADAWAKSLTDAANLSLSEQRIMEAVLWSFVEQLRATRMLAELGLLTDKEWRLRAQAESAFFLANEYGMAWWENYSSGNNALPADLVAAINNRLAQVDDNYSLNSMQNVVGLVLRNRDSEGQSQP